MIQELKILFRELADLSQSQREDYYAKRQAPPAVRAELESLLRCDAAPVDPMGSFVRSVVEQFLRSSTAVSEDDPLPPDATAPY